MQQAHDIAQKYLGKNTIQTKEHYEAKCTLTKYKCGDLVWYATDIKQLHLAPKLWVLFEGPYLILDKIGDLDYCIQLDAKGNQKVVHYNELMPHTGTRGCPGLRLPSKPRRSRGPTVYKTYLHVVQATWQHNGVCLLCVWELSRFESAVSSQTCVIQPRYLLSKGGGCSWSVRS